MQSAIPNTCGACSLFGVALMTSDETYDLVIDGRFVQGEQGFVCTPHEFMGMTGTLTVAGSQGT